MSSKLEPTEITAKELLYTEILNPTEKKAINELRKQLKRNSYAWIIAPTLGGCLAISFIYQQLTDKSKFAVADLLFFILGLIYMIYLVSTSINSAITLSKKNYKKAQYGIVHNKFSSNTAGDSNMREFLLTVKFPENNTLIRRVTCLWRRVYSSLDKDDKVLVVSFDNRNTYIVDIY